MRSVAIGVLTAILLAPSTANAWGFEAHKFIVARAIDILPEPLRPFFEANRAFIVERAIDPDLWRNAGFTEEPPNHFLDFEDRKSTRLNSSHLVISYAVFCFKNKTKKQE